MFWRKSALNKELVEYAEQEAKVLAEFQIECRVVLEKSRDTLMNILLAGAGGGLALAISVYEKEAADWIVAGTFMVSGYLFVLSGLMIVGFVKGRYVVGLGNDPDVLYGEAYKTMKLVAFKALNLQSRQTAIDCNRKSNAEFGAWLDNMRLLSAATPIWLILSYWLLG